MKYQAVIFDLFGTLVENFPASAGRVVMKNVASLLSVPPEDFNSLWVKTCGERMRGITADYRESIMSICRRLGASPTAEKIELAVTMRLELTRREVMSCREGAVETLSYLKQNGCKTGLVSNCSMETTAIWPETLLAPFIDVAVFSCVEGTMKPDPRLFQTALERLAVPPGNCIYVADGMSRELETASGLGMRAVLIEGHHETEYERDREDWRGEKIASLKEIMSLLD